MKALVLVVLLWQGCTLGGNDLYFIDGDAICMTGTTPEGPAMECWRNQ